MIQRYTPPAMEKLWTDEAKWNRVLKVELAVADVLAEDGLIPHEAARVMRRRAGFEVDKINEYETVVKHDVIAFLQSVGDSLGEYKRFLHLGLTSYDVIDTALSIALVKAGALIMNRLTDLRIKLIEQARKHKKTLMPGRTHGVHAEPTTFGWKICGWIAEADRNIERLEHAIENIRVGKISGAVGSYPTITPQQEDRICARLGLKPDPAATQVIARDRHGEYINTLALIGGLVERIALEIRLLQHSEVEELAEPFKKGQRGSSAMPHKKNPVAAENLCGLTRLLRSYANAAMENLPLWHERDISHSSVERIILPDSTALAYYMLERCAWVAENWDVDTERMKTNIENDRGLMASGQILTALKFKGIDDDDIYKRVQEHALEAKKTKKNLYDLIKYDREIVKAVGEEIHELFKMDSVVSRANIPFKRLGIDDEEN